MRRCLYWPLLRMIAYQSSFVLREATAATDAIPQDVYFVSKIWQIVTTVQYEDMVTILYKHKA